MGKILIAHHPPHCGTKVLFQKMDNRHISDNNAALSPEEAHEALIAYLMQKRAKLLAEKHDNDLKMAALKVVIAKKLSESPTYKALLRAKKIDRELKQCLAN